ncbi:DUF2071 domain-containing protein [soil metagenome]
MIHTKPGTQRQLNISKYKPGSTTSKSNSMKPLLTADWNNLMVVNYEIDPAELKPYLPAGTEPDLWNNKCYISLVAFQFSNPKIKEIPIPFYKSFEQINLRFHVRKVCNGEVRKGVVFIKEIATGNLLKAGAALLYNEHYTHLKTRHTITKQSNAIDIQYDWNLNKQWNYIHAVAEKDKTTPDPNTAIAFIANRFWGYTNISPDKTAKFRIEHEPWKIHGVKFCQVNCNIKKLYGETLHTFLSQAPAFTFMIDGSSVKVYNKKLCTN